jgi:DNA processing protein
MRQVLIYFSIKYGGDWEKIKNAIAAKEALEENQALGLLKDLDSNTLTMIDSNYPIGLKESYRPPFVLFYQGNISLLESPHKLGVIGARKNTAYGKKAAESLISSLGEKKNDICIVSGMAKGIDSIGQKEAMSQGMKVISVLGSGLDCCYPESSSDIYDYCQKEKGLLISEYPKGTKADAKNFPMRNRIIAGLIDSLLVIEAEVPSGTSITTKFALANGKDVLCVPNDIFSEMKFTNSLIHDGATMVLDAKDILESLRISASS